MLRRPRFDKKYWATYKVLDILQKVFYRSNPAREAFVEMCESDYVQKMTFDSYLYKTVVPGNPLDDIKLLVEVRFDPLTRGSAAFHACVGDDIFFLYISQMIWRKFCLQGLCPLPSLSPGPSTWWFGISAYARFLDCRQRYSIVFDTDGGLAAAGQRSAQCSGQVRQLWRTQPGQRGSGCTVSSWSAACGSQQAPSAPALISSGSGTCHHFSG